MHSIQIIQTKVQNKCPMFAIAMLRVTEPYCAPMPPSLDMSLKTSTTIRLLIMPGKRVMEWEIKD